MSNEDENIATHEVENFVPSGIRGKTIPDVPKGSHVEIIPDVPKNIVAKVIPDVPEGSHVEIRDDKITLRRDAKRLTYLTLEVLADAAYWCAVNDTPVYLIFSGPPATGKTWSTAALRAVPGITYINRILTPNELRKLIERIAAKTLLLIHDDFGLSPSRKIEDLCSVYNMVCDGYLDHEMFTQTQSATTCCSVILCCTKQQYYRYKGAISAGGLLDRMIPVVLNLSIKTRAEHNAAALLSSVYTLDVPKRIPDPNLRNPGSVKESVIKEYNLDTRLMNNIRRISQYLTEEQTRELILITEPESEGKYEI